MDQLFDILTEIVMKGSVALAALAIMVVWLVLVYLAVDELRLLAKEVKERRDELD